PRADTQLKRPPPSFAPYTPSSATTRPQSEVPCACRSLTKTTARQISDKTRGNRLQLVAERLEAVTHRCHEKFFAWTARRPSYAGVKLGCRDDRAPSGPRPRGRQGGRRRALRPRSARASSLDQRPTAQMGARHLGHSRPCPGNAASDV